MTHKYKRANKSYQAQLAKGVKLGKLRIDTLTGEISKRCSRCPPGVAWRRATNENFATDHRTGMLISHCRFCESERKWQYRDGSSSPWEKLFK